jgi:parallel beta-helix repeat protein
VAALTSPLPTVARIIYADNKLAANCVPDSYNVRERNCTGSEGIAFKTIQEAVIAIQPGDAVLIREGIYLEAFTIRQSGSAAAPIMISSLADETVTINGAKSTPTKTSGLISIIKSTHIRLSGLKTVSSNYFGIYVSGSSQITIQGCEVSRSNHGGIVATASSNITIANCEVHHNNDMGLSTWHEAISIEMVDTFEVKNCKVHNNKKEGIDAKYGASRGTIHQNEVFFNNGPSIYIDSANHIDISGNIVRSTANQGIGLAVESEHNPLRFTTYGIRVFNNLIYDNGCGIWFWVEPGAVAFARFENVSIINNVMTDNNRKNWGAIFFQGGHSDNYGNGLVIRNNVFWANTALRGARVIRDEIDARARWTIDHNLFQNGERSDAFGQDAVLTEDVQFMDGLNRNYRLRPGSPAIDAGSYMGAPATDFDGNSRPATLVDIGAFEYSANKPISSMPWIWLLLNDSDSSNPPKNPMSIN